MYDLLIKDGLVVDSFQEYMRKGMLRYQVILIETAELCLRMQEDFLTQKTWSSYPGLIDLHTHVSYNVISLSVDSEEACFSLFFYLA